MQVCRCDQYSIVHTVDVAYYINVELDKEMRFCFFFLNIRFCWANEKYSRIYVKSNKVM